MNIHGKVKSKILKVFPGWHDGRVWRPRFWSHAEKKTGTEIFMYSGSCFPPTVCRKGHWSRYIVTERTQKHQNNGFRQLVSETLQGPRVQSVHQQQCCCCAALIDIHLMQGGTARQWSWYFARSCSADGWPSRDEPASATGHLLHLKVCSVCLPMSWPASSFSLNLHLWESELSCECGLFLNWRDKIIFYWHFFSA